MLVLLPWDFVQWKNVMTKHTCTRMQLQKMSGGSVLVALPWDTTLSWGLHVGKGHH